jgi:hypothetical protein
MTRRKPRITWGRLAAGLSAAAFFICTAPEAHASLIDLYDFALSTNTGISGDWQDLSTADPTLIIDSSSSIYNDTNCCGLTDGTTTGLGTVNYTFTGGPGSYKVSMYFDFDVSTPFFNEYGTVNNAGAAQTGISYQIFNANTTSSNIVLFGPAGTPGGETYGLANNTNNVPGTTDNFLNTCTASNCNADVGMALTYSFTLGAGQEAVLSAIASTANPGGFSLETTHPVDADNNSASSVYLTGSYTVVPIPTSGAPEPSTWVLLGPALALIGMHRGFKRKARM